MIHSIWTSTIIFHDEAQRRRQGGGVSAQASRSQPARQGATAPAHRALLQGPQTHQEPAEDTSQPYNAAAGTPLGLAARARGKRALHTRAAAQSPASLSQTYAGRVGAGTSSLTQIKEDKLYYVGEEFLPHFDAFLAAQGKPPKQMAMPAPPQSLHRSSLSEVIPNYRQERPDPFEKTAQFEARRKLITDEDLSKRILLRMRRKEREQRQ